MQIKQTIGIALLCLVLIAGYTVVNAQDDEMITGKAPDFTLPDVDGNEVKLSQFTDKIIVLEWTNYDCPFVQAHYSDESQTMTELAIKYADQGVVWLTINSTYYATPESIKAWASKLGIEKQKLLVDGDGKVAKAYHAQTSPHMFVISKEGVIVYQGAIDNAPMGRKGETFVNYVDQALTQLIAGEAITIPQTKPYGCSVKYPPENKKPQG